MRYHALATDFDGTLAMHGKVTDETIEAMQRLRRSGRKLILVTGRHLDDLLRVMPQTHLFDRIVAENGAMVYNPATQEETPIGEPPTSEFIEELRKRNVPFDRGRVIVNTNEPHHTTVLEVIRDLQSENQMIFNKGAVMILPPGINKTSGLNLALEELGLSPHNLVGVGDAENDHAFLKISECAVAVDNALPALKEEADWVTKGAAGDGVIELIDHMLATDLKDLDPQLTRHHIQIGWQEEGEPVYVEPYGISMLMLGPSVSGKTSFAVAFTEALADKKYQFCVIDPEGDYQALEHLVILGDHNRAPVMKDVIELLEKTGQSCAASLMGIDPGERPQFFEDLLIRLVRLRTRTGRPHWVVIDEAHHMLPAAWEPVKDLLPSKMHGILYISVHPTRLSKDVLASVDRLIVTGEKAGRTLKSFVDMIEEEMPELPQKAVNPGEGIFWQVGEEQAKRVRLIQPESHHHRHRRKYASGDLGLERSFYFRGPRQKLKLRAKNLMTFIELARGVDDETWEYHLNNGDYQEWFRDVIKDEQLAEITKKAQEEDMTPKESREMILKAIRDRYTRPA